MIDNENLNPRETLKLVGYDEKFKRQVYINKVGIYDKHKNLIGIATLSNPVLKEEADQLTFKIKLDI